MADISPIDADVDSDVETTEFISQSPSSPPGPVRRYHNEEVIPTISKDEEAVGWGDEGLSYGDDWYVAERPPHHG